MRGVLVTLLVLFSGVAPARGAEGPAPAEPPPRHALYLELLGKGGLWGLGYDFEPRRGLAFGAVASHVVLDEERLTTFSPYAAIYPWQHGHHRWFVHGGPQIVHLRIPSPIPEWPGRTTTGVAAELSGGYEYRNHVLVRAFGMVAVGRGGAAPWFGLSIGWAL